MPAGIAYSCREKRGKPHQPSALFCYSITLDGRTRDNCTWAESYDALLYRIQSSGDTAERYSLMHQAETLLMQTGAVCPLYWYTDTYLCNTHVQGLLSGPLGAQYLMGAQVEK